MEYNHFPPIKKGFRENKLSRKAPTATFCGIKLSRKYSIFAKFTKISSLKVLE